MYTVVKNSTDIPLDLEKQERKGRKRLKILPYLNCLLSIKYQALETTMTSC